MRSAPLLRCLFPISVLFLIVIKGQGEKKVSHVILFFIVAGLNCCLLELTDLNYGRVTYKLKTFKIRRKPYNPKVLYLLSSEAD